MDIGTLTGSIALEDQLSSALAIVTDKVRNFADQFEGAFGGAIVVAEVAAAAIAGVTAAVTALGVRGASVQDVADTLDHFAGSSENAAAIMEHLRSGTRNTVDDFELLKTSSRLLSAGVKLTAQDFGTLGTAAFVLQDRGLGTTKEMMDLVSDAMVTGRTRALAMKLGVVDIGDAEATFAKSLGITKDQLSDTGKAEAHRIAVMGMLNSASKDAANIQRDFGDIVEQVKTKIKNWVDVLSQQVANSPKVMQAVDAIGAALKEAFGGSSDAAIKNIMIGINGFADGVKAAAPYIITMKDATVALFSFIADHATLIEALIGTWIAYKAAIVIATTYTTLMTVAEGLLVIGCQGAEAAIIAFTISTGPLLVALAAATAVLYAGKLAWDLWSQGAETAALAATTASKQQQVLVDVNKRYGTSFTTYSEAARYATMRIKEGTAALSGFVGPTESAAEAALRLANGVDSTSKSFIDMGKSAEEGAKKTQESIAKTAAMWDQYFALDEKMVGDDLGVKLSEIDRWHVTEMAALAKSKKGNANYWSELAALDDLYWKKLEEAEVSFSDQMIQTSRDIGEAASSAVNKGFAGMPAVLMTSAQTMGTVNLAARQLATTGVLVDTTYAQTGRSVVSAMNRSWQAGQPLTAQQKLWIEQMRAVGVSSEEMAAILGVGLNKVQSSSELFLSSLDNLAGALTQLAQVSGDSFGGIIKDLAKIVVAMNMAAKAAQDFKAAQAGGSKMGMMTSGIGMASAMWSATSNKDPHGLGHMDAKSTMQNVAGGATTGAAIGTMILPGVGTAIGLMAGAVIGLARSIHKVGEAEKEARTLAEDWSIALSGTLTQAQLNEAGGESWKQTIVGVRDAYLAAGFSATEAEGAVAALWDATRQGPEAVKKVTAAIDSVIAHNKAMVDAIHGMGFQTQEELQATANTAREVYEYMLRTGKYSAEQLQIAWEASAHAQAVALGDAAAVAQDAAAAAGYKTREQLESIAKKARDTYEYMRNSGLYTYGELEKAEQAMADAQAAALGQASAGVDSLAARYKSLSDSVAKEAPEKVMGSIEKATRAEMATLKAQMDAQSSTLKTNTTEVAKQVENALNNIHPQPIHIQVIYDTQNAPSNMAGGGIVYAASGTVVPFKSSGTDTVPAMLTPGERVLTVSQNSAYERGGQQPSNQEVVDAVNGLRADIVTKLPRAIARSVDSALVGLRTAS